MQWRRQWHPTPVHLPGKSHGQRSLVGCSPWGRKESDTTEWLHFHFHALEKEMATHSSVLAWRIPWTEEPGGLQSIGSQRVRHDWSHLALPHWEGLCSFPQDSHMVALEHLTKYLVTRKLLSDTMDCSLPGFSVHGILQARTLESVAISFSNAWKWKVKVKSLSKCPTLRDPMDCSLPDSSVHGVFQARVLEWVLFKLS